MSNATSLPPLREDLDLLPGDCLLDGAPTWMLYDPVKHLFHRMGRKQIQILKSWSLGAPEAIAEAIDPSHAITAEDVTDLQTFLDRADCLEQSSDELTSRMELATKQKPLLQRWLHHYLFIRIPLVQPDDFLRGSLLFVKPFFTRTFWSLTFLAAIVGLYLTSRQWEVFTGGFDYFFTLDGMLIVLISIAVTKVCHELGHAYTSVRQGAHIPHMGVALIVLLPMLYTDTHDTWRLTSSKARLQIGAAGMMIELAIASWALLAWHMAPAGPLQSALFVLATTSWVMTLGINANPFMRWDGYYLLSDYLKIDNLHSRAFALGRWWLRGFLFGLDVPPPEYFNSRKQAGLIIFAHLIWAYRLVMFAGIALMVYFMFTKTLGLFLMLVELTWFIGKPIGNEVKTWIQLMKTKQITINRHTYITGAFLLLMLLLLILPWHSSISAPAYLHAKNSAEIYTPYSGMLRTINVKNSQAVKAGQVLAVIQDEVLEYDVDHVKRQITELRYRIKLVAIDPNSRDQIQIYRQHLLELESQQQNLKARLWKSMIRSPIDGIVTDIDPDLANNTPINDLKPIMRVIDPAMAQIVAYIPEKDLARIEPGTTLRFYPDMLSIAPLNAVIDKIEMTAVKTLYEPMMLSIYGGSVAAETTPDGRHIPRESVFLFYATPDSMKNIPVTQILRGVVRIEGDRVSPLMRMMKAITTKLIMESGF